MSSSPVFTAITGAIEKYEKKRWTEVNMKRRTLLFNVMTTFATYLLEIINQCFYRGRFDEHDD